MQGQEASRPPEGPGLSPAANSQHVDLPQAWGHGESMPSMASGHSWLLPTHHALFLLCWKRVVTGSPFIHPCGSHKLQLGAGGGRGMEGRAEISEF